MQRPVFAGKQGLDTGIPGHKGSCGTAVLAGLGLVGIPASHDHDRKVELEFEGKQCV